MNEGKRKEMFLKWHLFQSKIVSVASAFQNDIEFTDEGVEELKKTLNEAEEELRLLSKETIATVSAPTTSEEE